jgi:hypothetical protein
MQRHRLLLLQRHLLMQRHWRLLRLQRHQWPRQRRRLHR